MNLLADIAIYLIEDNGTEKMSVRVIVTLDIRVNTHGTIFILQVLQDRL